MDLRSLDIDDLHRIYDSCLTRDFPADELMPWKHMVPLMETGRQRAVGFWDQEGLAAYAVFICTGEPHPAAVLLNYFAVQPDRRGKGVCSECLRMMREALGNEGCRIIFEVEDPDAAQTPEESQLRQCRIDFYLRGGAAVSGVGSTLFGVKYRIMTLSAPGPALPDHILAGELETLYRSMLSQRTGFPHICRVYTLPPKEDVPSPSRETTQFSRELGRALTFLMRSRKRFMGEKLKEYGFNGAMYLILLHVDRHPGATQDSIATHMYLDKCSVARRTKKLEELGCLYREQNPLDRRQNNLFLTEKGQALAPKIRSYLSQWGDQVTAGLSESERQTLLVLLTKMTGQDKA